MRIRKKRTDLLNSSRVGLLPEHRQGQDNIEIEEPVWYRSTNWSGSPLP